MSRSNLQHEAPTIEPANKLILDWHTLNEPQAFIELCNRLGVSVRVKPDGGLGASGNIKQALPYLSDISAHYRGSIVACLLGLPAPELSAEQDCINLVAIAQALDVTITDYCTAANHTTEHRERLLAVRRKMKPAYLVQNLCAFRWWLYEVKRR